MKKLLIVDDVATNLRLVTELLKGEYEVIAAKSGEQALHIVTTRKPDIILLDIGMPKMDGYAVMEKLRTDPTTVNIPVIFLTGDTSKEAEARALQCGAMDFIRKPFEPMILKSRIEKALTIASMRNDLEATSKKDALTGLWNRSYLEEVLENLKEDDKGFLFMLDLDNFKGLNDTFGHIAGDDALTKFSTTLLSLTDDDDIVCRLGGDEFIIYRRNTDDREAIRVLARNIIAEVEYNINESLTDEMEKQVSVSVGISQYPEDGHTFLELYNAADKALYYVKQNGKRGYHFYQDDCRTLAEITKESSLIDMQQLRKLISENGSGGGAYQVEYEGFKRIYRFVNRFAERTGQNVQIVLFTLTLKEGESDDTLISKSIDILEHHISGLLRRADVATQYSSNQYVVILMDTTEQNGMIAVRRVMDDFQKSGLGDNINIDYAIQDIVKR